MVCGQKPERMTFFSIKVIGTDLHKPNLSYIILAKSIWTLVGCPDLNFIFQTTNETTQTTKLQPPKISCF